MYQLTTHASFDSAHFLSGYEGKCRNLHGHRWKLEVTVSSEELVAGGTDPRNDRRFWRTEKRCQRTWRMNLITV